MIWGQDPYPHLNYNNTPNAQGYSFGVSKGEKIPNVLAKKVAKDLKVHQIYLRQAQFFSSD